MKNVEIDKNIENFLFSQILEDCRLQKWLLYYSKIEDTLANRA